MIVDFHRRAITLGYFVRIAGAEHIQPGDRPARSQMLHRLVRRPVFADANRIVRQDVQHRPMHDAGQSHAAAHVIGKDKEGRRIGAQTGQRHPVDDAGHRVLADAEVHVAAGVMAGQKITFAIQMGLVAGCQVGRTADHKGQVLGDRVENFAAAVAGRVAFFTGLEYRDIFVPTGGKPAVKHCLQNGRLIGVG